MITPQRRSIEQILNESKQYSIPDYQRDFEWKRENAEELWMDLEGGDFFIGTLIFDISNQEYVSVVDGQQRLTTIFILLAAMREQAKAINEDGLARAIQDKMVFRSRTGDVRKSKLVSAEKIREVFEQTITSDDWDGIDFNFRNKKRQVNKIKPVYDFFRSKLTSCSREDLEGVVNRLYDSFAVVIEIEATEEAFDIFERTNSRGVDLNAADLLKNYLFARMNPGYSEELKNTWDRIVDRAYGNTLRMIKHFYVSKAGYITKKDLFKKIKQRGENIGAEALLKEIDIFSKHYALIVGGTKDAVLEWASEFTITELQKEYNAEALNRSFDAINLFSVAQSYPVFVKVMDLVANIQDEEARNKAAKKMISFVRALENFHFINSAVVQKQANTVEVFYADVCEQNILPESVGDFMEQVVQNLREQKLASKGEFVVNFKDINYESNFLLTYYINDRLNNQYLDESNLQKIYNPDRKILKRNFNIEHLVSQSDSEYSFEIDEDTTHNIGNLIVIPMHVNSSMLNIHIEEKLARLRDETTTLPEVKVLLDEWSDKEWGTLEAVQENVKERAARMAEQCYDEVFRVSV